MVSFECRQGWRCLWCLMLCDVERRGAAQTVDGTVWSQREALQWGLGCKMSMTASSRPLFYAAEPDSLHCHTDLIYFSFFPPPFLPINCFWKSNFFFYLWFITWYCIPYHNTMDFTPGTASIQWCSSQTGPMYHVVQHFSESGFKVKHFYMLIIKHETCMSGFFSISRPQGRFSYSFSLPLFFSVL